MNKTKLTNIILRSLLGLILLGFYTKTIHLIFQHIYSFKFTQGVDMNLINSFRTIFYLTYLITPILYLLSTIGYFLKKLLGWIFVTNLFYFTLFDLFFIKIPSYYNPSTVYFLLLVPLSLIILMNLKAMRQIYNIKNRMIIYSNLVSALSGLIFVFISGYLKLHHTMQMFEIIEKLKLHTTFY